MPNVNPPGDRAEAADHPLLVLRDMGAIGYMAGLGPIKRADTLPVASFFRYVILYGPDDSVYSGYLWKEDDGTIPEGHSPGRQG